jgi:choice-of-anchor C domain-containing protein
MSGRRSLIATTMAVLALVLGVAVPAAPALAVIKINATVVASTQLDAETCTVGVAVLTFASFSETVRADQVKIEFSNGGPLGVADFHNYPGGTTYDQFVFKFGGGDLKPGAYGVKATWQARNGNGLSTAYGTATTTLVPPVPAAGKMGPGNKCGLTQTAADYRHAALTFSAAAHGMGTSCAKCARAMNDLADLTADFAMLDEELGNDPPDPDFTTLPVASPPSVAGVSASPEISAGAASALTAVQTQLAHGIGQARAALHGVERAQGAHAAGDQSWEQKQSLAAAGFLTGLASDLAALPAKFDAAGAALRAGGFPNPAIDQAAVQAYLRADADEEPAARNGLTVEEVTLGQAALHAVAEGLSGSIALLDAFAAAGFDQAAAVAALKADAAALTANPLLLNDPPPTAGPSPSASPSPVPPPTIKPTVAETASLLSNSGFEAPALNGAAYQTLAVGKDPSLTGWTLKKGSIDVVTSGGGVAATGGQFIDLNGNDTNAGPGTITQKVKVQSGHRYRLAFQLAGNPNGDPKVKTVEVSLGSTKKTFTFDTTGHTNEDLGWTAFTLEANAGCGASTITVTFASKTDGSRGPNLDNVVLEDIGGASCSPIQGWWIAAGGAIVVLAAIGIFVYVRRKRPRPAANADSPMPADAASAAND